MGFLFRRPEGLLLTGFALGAALTYAAAHRGARSFQAEAAARAPRGCLVAGSGRPGEASVSLILAKNYGRNPGDPVRYYSGGATTPAGSVSFSYPPSPAPGMGDVILVKFVAWGEPDRTFVVRNGDFGTLIQDPGRVLTYAP
ncbi:hypothetical protein [Mesoterricola silvestris]|uniref:Uncharacterized protein n=1 Tax=Mesoterricola silvestris TaxID=2927979 RepID=A0AA48KAB3_9BACT|nr:hypothetical protein [Mesoterricola silvestris]BDU74451.1 hypothetical protein METEAL_36250 [Mesoterricola silvestris]